MLISQHYFCNTIQRHCVKECSLLYSAVGIAGGCSSAAAVGKWFSLRLLQHTLCSKSWHPYPGKRFYVVKQLKQRLNLDVVRRLKYMTNMKIEPTSFHDVSVAWMCIEIQTVIPSLTMQTSLLGCIQTCSITLLGYEFICSKGKCVSKERLCHGPAVNPQLDEIFAGMSGGEMYVTNRSHKQLSNESVTSQSCTVKRVSSWKFSRYISLQQWISGDLILEKTNSF